MKIEISIGEVVDRYTILLIKSLKIQDLTKLKNINKELVYLVDEIKNGYPSIMDEDFVEALLEVNKQLWEVEDDLRDLERFQDFGERFVQLARKVYKLNTKRTDIKKQINIKYNSNFVEEKFYQPY